MTRKMAELVGWLEGERFSLSSALAKYVGDDTSGAYPYVAAKIGRFMMVNEVIAKIVEIEKARQKN